MMVDVATAYFTTEITKHTENDEKLLAVYLVVNKTVYVLRGLRGEKSRKDTRLQKSVGFHLLPEVLAADAEHLGCLRAIAAGEIERVHDVRLLALGDNVLQTRGA